MVVNLHDVRRSCVCRKYPVRIQRICSRRIAQAKGTGLPKHYDSVNTEFVFSHELQKGSRLQALQ
jgi:hypothetical protein